MRSAESSGVGARKNTDAEDDVFRVIERPLFRHKSRSVTLAETPPPPKPEPVRTIVTTAHAISAGGARPNAGSTLARAGRPR